MTKIGRPPTPAWDRFWAKVDASGDCWEWTGVRRLGYGSFRVHSTNDPGSRVSAHRYAWERLVGEIESGLTLDHLCRNKACVNPDHLEPVTIEVNVSRASWSTRAKTHCPKGHPYSGENLYTWGNRRRCKACQSEWTRTWQQKRKALVR